MNQKLNKITIEGKLQPQAIELEKAILGALLIDNESLSDAIDSLREEYFYKIEHQKIFLAIVNLFNKTQPVDILTVSEELKRMKQLENIGGISYITDLTNNISSSSNTSKALISKSSTKLMNSPRNPSYSSKIPFTLYVPSP